MAEERRERIISNGRRYKLDVAEERRERVILDARGYIVYKYGVVETVISWSKIDRVWISGRERILGVENRRERERMCGYRV